MGTLLHAIRDHKPLPWNVQRDPELSREAPPEPKRITPEDEEWAVVRWDRAVNAEDVTNELAGVEAEFEAVLKTGDAVKVGAFVLGIRQAYVARLAARDLYGHLGDKFVAEAAKSMGSAR